MAYRVVFTENGLSCYNHCVEYILRKFQDGFATKGLIDDIEDTLVKLATMARSYPICENPGLYRREVRKVHLLKHNYKIFYRIVDDCEVHIDAILNDLQDYENILR